MTANLDSKIIDVAKRKTRRAQSQPRGSHTGVGRTGTSNYKQGEATYQQGAANYHHGTAYYHKGRKA